MTWLDLKRAALILLSPFLAATAHAADVTVVIKDGNGRAVEDAVVIADVAGRAGPPPARFVINQKDMQFVPYVLIVPVGSTIEFGNLGRTYQQSTFAAHFVEAAVDAYTGESRVRRMLAVCDAGRILNPKTARSQVIGGMTMGLGAALMEELAVDKRFGFFVNHDLAGYEVPVHADIPHQEVIFLGGSDDKSSPMKAKGVGELGICGVGAAIANAVYNACGVRVRDYPITLDKMLDRMA